MTENFQITPSRINVKKKYKNQHLDIANSHCIISKTKEKS